MTVVYPEGTPTLGNTKLVACATVANLAAPKLATEINAATSVELSGYLRPSGWQPTGTPGKGTKPARLASKNQLEQFNRTQYTLTDLQYAYDPQAADSDAGNEAKELLLEGTEIVLVERIGLDAEDVAYAVAQQTRSHKVTLGPQIPSGDRTDENDEFFITQSLIYVNNGPVDGVIAT